MTRRTSPPPDLSLFMSQISAASVYVHYCRFILHPGTEYISLEPVSSNGAEAEVAVNLLSICWENPSRLGIFSLSFPGLQVQFHILSGDFIVEIWGHTFVSLINLVNKQISRQNSCSFFPKNVLF